MTTLRCEQGGNHDEYWRARQDDSSLRSERRYATVCEPVTPALCR